MFTRVKENGMLAVILLTISLIFLIILGLKKLLSVKACALCGGVALTWVGLLMLYKLGIFTDAILLSLLMGQSVTGIYYTIDKRVIPALRIFTLPFFLTLTTVFYMTVAGVSSVLPPLLILLGLWVLAYVVFTYRNDPGKKSIANAVMNCCEDK